MPADHPILHLLEQLAVLHADALSIVAVLRSARAGQDPDAALQHTWADRIARAHHASFTPIRRDLAAEGCTLPHAPLPLQREDLELLRTATHLPQLRASLHRIALQLETSGAAAACFAEALGLSLLARQLRAWCRTWIGLQHRLEISEEIPSHAQALAA